MRIGCVDNLQTTEVHDASVKKPLRGNAMIQVDRRVDLTGFGSVKSPKRVFGPKSNTRSTSSRTCFITERPVTVGWRKTRRS